MIPECGWCFSPCIVVATVQVADAHNAGKPKLVGACETALAECEASARRKGRLRAFRTRVARLSR